MKAAYITAILGIFCALVGCRREEIPTYADSTSERFIYFSRSESDSTDLSFYSYPGETSIKYPIAVQSSGYSTQDAEFKISVMEEYTTAETSDYALPDKYIFRGGIERDTIYVRFNYSPKLDDEKIRLVIRLDSNENFSQGPSTNIVAVIWVHNNIVKPAWWTSSVSSYYLGPYTDEKYREFLNVVKVDLTDADNSTIRNYALIFKQYLAARKAAGDPVLEKDGTEMTVVAGGK